MELLVAAAVKPGRAVVVVTHDNRVFHHADVIAEMEDGVIRDIRRNGSLRRSTTPNHAEMLP
jgi:putative ABC transport system ATP-binding protein